MFKLKPNKAVRIDTLIGANTRINGDIEFSGGLHLDGYINGNVSGNPAAGATMSVSEQGGIEGSVVVCDISLNGIVKGDIDAADRVELGEKAQVLGNVTYAVIETAVGAQINGRLIHRANTGGNRANTAGERANTAGERANTGGGASDADPTGGPHL